MIETGAGEDSPRQCGGVLSSRTFQRGILADMMQRTWHRTEDNGKFSWANVSAKGIGRTEIETDICLKNQNNNRAQ